jgi:hypothetical protein
MGSLKQSAFVLEILYYVYEVILLRFPILSISSRNSKLGPNDFDALNSILIYLHHAVSISD